MNKTKSIILTFALLCTMSSTTKSALTDILSKYCVPPNASNCTGDSRATYNSARNTCECNSIERFYKSDSRTCEECITGSWASSDYKTCEPVVCPAGYEPVLITNGACPSGYELKQITNNNCPSDSNLKTYTVTTKSWR